MNGERPGVYRFSTEQQWSTCLFAGADRDGLSSRKTVRAQAPYGGPPARFAAPGAHAPAVTAVRERLWRDGNGCLYRFPVHDDHPHSVPAPFAIAGAKRLVATTRSVWAAIASPPSLHCFDLESLTRRLVVELPGTRVIDIAPYARDGLIVLIEDGDERKLVRVDSAGQVENNKGFTTLGSSMRPAALVWLRREKRVVLMETDVSALHWLELGKGTPTHTVNLGSVRPCFTGEKLASDGRSRIAVAGLDHTAFGGGAYALVLDIEGNLLDEIALEEKATGIAVTHDEALITTASGLLRFACSDTASDAGETRLTLITPMLQSPPGDPSRRWLRIEATASLPPGSSIEMSYFATDDVDVLRRAREIEHDPALPSSQRLNALQSFLGDWSVPVAYAGSATHAASVPVAAPLHAARADNLWVLVTLTAAPGAKLPELATLEVLYPDRTLLDHLPALYQRKAEEPGSFLRSLIGVLESTTQTLDARIAAMGSLAHPDSAPTPWLDYIAEWLGLPWDGALSDDQKRAIVRRAAEIAAGRGTRAGLDALLGALMPQTPRRYRVVDITADYGLATVGGKDCLGSELPAVLGARASTAVRLGRKGVLGYARLAGGGCKEDDYDDPSRFVGHIRVDVTADADERRAWQPWLHALIAEMMPVTARFRLRWLSPASRFTSYRLHDELTLEAPPQPHLGTDAVTGLARLPAERPSTLSSAGPNTETRLY